MRPHVVMVTLLLVAAVLLDAVACLLENTRSDYSQIFIWSLFFAQINLLSLWVGLGTAYWLVRIASLGCAIVAIPTAFAVMGFTNVGEETATIFAIQAAAVLPFAAVARFLGFRWTIVDPHSSPDCDTSAHHFQFTIRRMLAWTTVAAVVAALARRADFPSGETATFVLVYISNTIITFTAAWAVASNGRILRRLLLLILVAGFLSVLERLAIRTSGPPFSMLMLIVLHALFVAGWLGACRLVGIRIVRYRRPGPAEVDTVNSP